MILPACLLPYQLWIGFGLGDCTNSSAEAAEQNAVGNQESRIDTRCRRGQLGTVLVRWMSSVKECPRVPVAPAFLGSLKLMNRVSARRMQTAFLHRPSQKLIVPGVAPS